MGFQFEHDSGMPGPGFLACTRSVPLSTSNMVMAVSGAVIPAMFLQMLLDTGESNLRGYSEGAFRPYLTILVVPSTSVSSVSQLGKLSSVPTVAVITVTVVYALGVPAAISDLTPPTKAAQTTPVVAQRSIISLTLSTLLCNACKAVQSLLLATRYCVDAKSMQQWLSFVSSLGCVSLTRHQHVSAHNASAMTHGLTEPGLSWVTESNFTKTNISQARLSLCPAQPALASASCPSSTSPRRLFGTPAHNNKRNEC